MYDVEKEIFFLNWMTAVEEDMTNNYLRRVSDLM